MTDEKRAADDAERMERILAAFAYLNPDHPTVLAALEEIRQLQDAALSARADGGEDSSDHKFKNFHRLLCERFGYMHDEVDWKRDQISLIEWIAKRVADGGKGEAVGTVSRGSDQHPYWHFEPVISWEKIGDGVSLYTAPQAECAPREAQPMADEVLEFAIALEKERALHIVRAVREQGFSKSENGIPTQAESVFDLACEEIEHRLRTEVWELDGIAAPTPERAQPISDAMMDLVDRLGSEASEVEPRAWKHLLVYAPERADAAPNPSDKQEAFAPRVYDDYGQNDPPVDLSSSADAEKDAALTDEEIDRIWTMVTGTYTSDCPWDVHAFVHAAILAAIKNKENNP